MSAILHNGQALARAAIPEEPDLSALCARAAAHRARVSALFALPAEGSEALDLHLVLADDDAGRLELSRARIAGRGFPSLTPICPQVHLFEREIWERFGIEPRGHPWLKPVRYRRPWRTAGPVTGPMIGPGVTSFFQVSGLAVHEVAVGPVHAGVIEPGHFRFQCHGEEVLHLEIALGYQHRGVEEALLRERPARHLHLMETLAGDTSIGHALAYSQAQEALTGGSVSARAQAIRAIALELERIANHTGDLGALAGDVGFLPVAAYCGRLRGEFLNLTAAICGNRLGRSLVRPGGVRFDVTPAVGDAMLGRLDSAARDLERAVNLLWETPSVQARFEETGRLGEETALTLGMVGPAARACGLERDVRVDHPSGFYRFAQVPLSTSPSGDVFGRAFVRWLELQRSIAFVRRTIGALPEGELLRPCGPPAAGCVTVALVEGWRGEICHVAMTGPDGKLAGYKVVDPSFHNWTGLAIALRGQQISDFPLCNKSFNLSYCGHDL